MYDWLRRQYADIRGNLKYEILRTLILAVLGAAGIITFAVGFWQKLKQIPLDYYFLGGLFVASVTVFFYFTIKLQSLGTAPRSTPKRKTPVVAEPSDPRKPNLKADVFEILFHIEKIPGMVEISILVHLQIVNHGEQEVVIVEWKLDMEVGDRSVECEEEPIPKDWKIARRQGRGWQAEVLEEIKPVLTSPTEPLRKGVPIRGWVNFKWTVLGQALAPHNAKFTLKATDALGTEHVAAASGPAFLEEKGEIRRA